MRLYLSSFRMGNHTHRLLGMLRGGRRTALIRNAVEGLPFRQDSLDRDVGDLEQLGLDVTLLDLRAPDAVERLQDFDLLFVRGGNVFTLRRVLAETGADAAILELLHRDAVVYAGFSAGPCILSPDLLPLAAVDPIGDMPDPVTTGLGILDRLFMPHVDSPGHPETADCTRLADQLAAQGLPHWRLRDGDVLVRDGERDDLLT
ncbi:MULTISPECIES: Type 1 glutamine amidotransferase-like domain-containing protein [Deinococcus]|uniref:Type 1 glutamine amidotransferase-like domain-containing protein n=1 Tax=Deinococcus rufus TaxID=2136097 RepID=A0ABV7Z3P2_9DEIO|nr:Type 1 glutamine amidotransferase-like domain-containing protein [Deinococcus sp. AB2017081]WQE95937.1 Type 1 glutamine amidotransferase-like domain-containing protein [Deinococcus sp. AB2017081]